MPIYEYHCRICDIRFEQLRPMSAATEPALCPSGHEAMRVLSVFSAVARSESGETVSLTSSCPCGGACSCGAASL